MRREEAPAGLLRRGEGKVDVVGDVVIRYKIRLKRCEMQSRGPLPIWPVVDPFTDIEVAAQWQAFLGILPCGESMPKRRASFAGPYEDFDECNMCTVFVVQVSTDTALRSASYTSEGLRADHFERAPPRRRPVDRHREKADSTRGFQREGELRKNVHVLAERSEPAAYVDNRPKCGSRFSCQSCCACSLDRLVVKGVGFFRSGVTDGVATTTGMHQGGHRVS